MSFNHNHNNDNPVSVCPIHACVLYIQINDVNNFKNKPALDQVQFYHNFTINHFVYLFDIFTSMASVCVCISGAEIPMMEKNEPYGSLRYMTMHYM
ncbi:hypothetical protein DERP_007992 [Dermatophagoides pteronyssinus]|uniref:Uncharacterized protein n=1 Tax=Dermatophagoides pteronyssinus TaxID=6956 RepID=A0ABQ8IT95_DERPT|nr:hypothetical protein DERP_007992 [Dermatophagoides pteronyssinus]